MTITNYRAKKIGGSYQADGTIVSTFATLAGETRHVFEFDQPAGMLHIFGPGQVEIAESVAAPQVAADERTTYDISTPMHIHIINLDSMLLNYRCAATPEKAAEFKNAILKAVSDIAAPVQAQEPVALLTLGGIDGDEYGDNDLELVSSKAVEKLQAQLVRGQNPVVLELFAHSAPVQPVAVPQVEVLLAALNNIAEACNCCGDRSDLAVMAQEALDEYADAAPAVQGDLRAVIAEALSPYTIEGGRTDEFNECVNTLCAAIAAKAAS